MPRGMSCSSSLTNTSLKVKVATDRAAHAQRVPVAADRKAGLVAGTAMYSVSRASGVVAFHVFGAQHAVVVGRAGQLAKILRPLTSQPPSTLRAVVPNGARPAAAALPSLNGWA
jgi:hypothetical protein